MSTLRWARAFCWQILLVLTVGCSNGRGSLEESEPPPPAGGVQESFSIGGSVSGLVGSGLVLQNNGGGDLTIATDGTFTFTGRLAAGAVYNVTVLSQPNSPAQTCSVANASGNVTSDVSNVEVTCATGQFSVGGDIAGLTGTGLVLRNNAGDDLPISSNGPFTFPNRLTSGATYNVSVRTQPSGQSCIVRNASGTITQTNIANVNVSCASNQFTVSGTVTGLSGSGLVLQLNGEHDLPIVTNGAFAFEVGVPGGTAYEIVVRTQPRDPTQVCSVSNARGTVTVDVTSVLVSCNTRSFSVSGTVGGLVGSGLVLQLNAGNDLPVASNGSFTFSGAVASGAQYRVNVVAQPSNPTQRCTIANGSGTVGSGNVTNVRVACASASFAVGGTVLGLLGRGLVLQNNGADSIRVEDNGAFQFPSDVASGGVYDVTVHTQPSGPNQSCSVTNGRGTVGSADISNVVISCSTSDFTIGGVVRELSGSGLVLRNNGSDDLRISSDGEFTFGTALPSGATYDVRIAEQPRNPDQTCTVSNGSGVVGSNSITSIVVQCSTRGFLIGGHVSELRGRGLVLQNNGSDDLDIASNGSFNFATPLPGGAAYNVTIARQPERPDQSCIVQNAAGTVDNSNVQNVEVKCRREKDDD